MVGGWYDIFQQGTLDMFAAIQTCGGPKAKKHVHLLMGPWTHAVGVTRVGELTFPDHAKWADEFPRFDAWADRWLLDKPMAREVPPVLYYTMGALPAGSAPGNRWRTATAWPPPGNPTRWHLTADGLLRRETVPPAGRRTFRYDPGNPVPTRGGANLVLPAGSFDQVKQEERDDVLLFTSDALSEPMEVTGRLRAVLHVATTAADTDFTAKLTDVYPDGRSMLIADGICRLSLRDSLDRRSDVACGEIYSINVDLWSTSYVFNTGHRIRLAISSSNSPRFEPHPNRDLAGGSAGEPIVATQTILVGSEHPSHLLLPIVK
jgi:putative CocE/NonD family hydrolase